MRSYAVFKLVWVCVCTSALCFRCISPHKSFKLLSAIPESLVPSVSQHTRRKRYTGKYPRGYTEKYKEVGGDVATIAKVTAKGGTAAGQHRPIMLDECMQFLGIKLNAEMQPTAKNDALCYTENVPLPSICIDCTFGYGGHSREILTHIAPHGGVLHAVDQDGIELTKTTARLEPLASQLQQQHGQRVLYTRQENFGNLMKYTDSVGITGKVSAILCDLGYSSMQIDDPARGFSYKHDGPLDMRMRTSTATKLPEVSVSAQQSDCSIPQLPTHTGSGNAETSGGMSAYEYLCQVKSVSALAAVLRENSDVETAVAIAVALLGRDGHEDGVPRSTLEFANRVRRALEVKHSGSKAASSRLRGASKVCVDSQGVDQSKNAVTSTASAKTDTDSAIAKCMQAIRIEVNQEFLMLEQLLTQVPQLLAPKGRIVFLTFHSGEDRRVKKSLKAGAKAGIYSHWGRDVIVASNDERFSNPRSKCAKLRWAIKA